MQLSRNQKILFKVDDSSLTNGTFIFPEEVTTIGACAFYNCSALTQIIIHEGITEIRNQTFQNCRALTQITISKTVTTISYAAFYNCSALTQITIPEGVTTIGNFVFSGCNNLQVIAVNTSHRLELERISALLPAEHRTKIIKNPFYGEVIKFQQTAYQSMLPNPKLNALIEFYIFYYAKIPLAIFALISGFETSVHQDFQKKAGTLSFPLTGMSLQQYKHDFNDAFGLSLTEESNQSQESSKDVLEPQLLCIAQLRKYVGFINQQKEIKQKKHPNFFTEKETLWLGINNQRDAIEKAITFLRGGSESNAQFTSAEIAILGKGFIGDTLGEIIISLPSDSSQQLAL